jgi:uncharacterized membrane protein YgaE (UPF0421/DUF939 family)
LALAAERLRPRLRPILQTAASAVIAYYLALLLLSDKRPAFASIAAVIALGASYGEQRQRALQLAGGVVLGLGIADVIVHAIGSGPAQIGVMVVLAMMTAVILGGGELLISEAAVSAILLVALTPGSDASTYSPNRILEALIGGGVAFAVSALFFPPDPALHVGRAAQALFAQLGQTLQRVADSLAGGDPASAERALDDARETDRLVLTLEDALRTGWETARFAPPRRGTRAPLERYARSLGQIDFAVRDTRVLARHALRRLRAGEPDAAAAAPAVQELALAVWELAASFERPERAVAARGHAVAAAGMAGEPQAAAAGPEINAQVRSTAVDLRRAADLAGGTDESVHERPTEELLAA